ncbi:MAG: ATP-binding protein [Phototrophicaceae bacterium]
MTLQSKQKAETFINKSVQISEPLLQFIRASLNVDHLGVYLKDSNQLVLVNETQNGAEISIKEVLSHLIENQQLSIDSPLVVSNFKEDSAIDSMLLTPFTHADGQVYGVLFAIVDKRYNWTANDKQTLQDSAQLLQRDLDLQHQLANEREQNKHLQAQQLLFQQVTDSLSDAIILLNQDTEIIYCNQAIADIFGYDPNDLINQPIEILIQSTINLHITQFVATTVDETRQNNALNGTRMQGRKRDGTVIPIQVKLDTMMSSNASYFKVVIRDMSLQEYFEDQLQYDVTRYLEILDAIPDMVYVKDEHSRLIWANRTFTHFFNKSLDELLGESHIAGVGTLNVVGSLDDDAFVLSTGKTRVTKEEAIIRYDGVTRQFVTTKKPIFNEQGQVRMLVGISKDVTETKNVERYLMNALEDRQELVELKSAFISMVSHEFRTPLSVILSSVDIIQNYYERLTDERRQEKLFVIQNQVKRLTRLMDEVLLINRGDAKGLPFSPVYTDVIELSERIIEEVQSTYSESLVMINFKYDACAKSQYIDADLYRHIVQNLLSNALKYSKVHSDVQFSINCSDTKITIVVADTGIGIPQANHANLFQTFQRADNVGTIQGTGLGLAIVKRAVDTHGGTINFRSIENQGTMFVVTLNTQNTHSEGV